MSTYSRIFLGLAAAAAAIALAGCPGGDSTVTGNRDAPPQGTEPAASSAVVSSVGTGEVVFIAGDVTVLRGSEWLVLDIGDEVAESESVKTGADGECEIVFGSKASIRLKENTQIALSTVNLAPQKNTIDINVIAGSVLNKVEKLSGQDSFNTTTETTVCGVRGTQYLVEVDEAGTTKVAVREGSVAVVPASPIIDKLADEAQTNAVALAAIDAIVTASPVVNAGESLVIDSAAVAAAEEGYKAMEAEVAATPPVPIPQTEDKPGERRSPIAIIRAESAPASSSEAAQDASKRLSDKAEKGIKPKGKKPVKADPATEKKLDEIDEMKPIPEGAVAAAHSGTTPATPASGQGSSASPASPGSGKGASGSTPAASGSTPAASGSTPAASGSTPSASGKPESAGSGKGSASAAPAKTGPIVGRFQVSGRRLTGSLIQSGGLLITADGKGSIFAYTLGGAKAWSVNTGNSENENSFPVSFKGRLYFSGSSELVIIDAASGSVISRTALDDQTRHVFGARVAPAPNTIVYPTSTGVNFIDPVSGTVLSSVEIPDGTAMTPALYKQFVIVVSQKGLLVKIDPESAQIVAQVQTGAFMPVALAPRILGDLACFADRKGLLVLVNLASMSVVWEKKLAEGVFADIEFQKDGLFIYTKGGTLYGFNADGSPIMEPLKGISAPPLLSLGVLYYCTRDGNLVVAKPNPFTPGAKVALDDVASTRPLVIEGFLYVGTEKGALLKIDLSALK